MSDAKPAEPSQPTLSLPPQTDAGAAPRATAARLCACGAPLLVDRAMKCRPRTCGECREAPRHCDECGDPLQKARRGRPASVCRDCVLLDLDLPLVKDPIARTLIRAAPIPLAILAAALGVTRQRADQIVRAALRSFETRALEEGLSARDLGSLSQPSHPLASAMDVAEASDFRSVRHERYGNRHGRALELEPSETNVRIDALLGEIEARVAAVVFVVERASEIERVSSVVSAMEAA